METDTTRRAVLGAAGFASIALLAPVTMAASPNGSATFRALLDADDAARHRFNNLPEDLEYADEKTFRREEDRMHAAAAAAEEAVPTNWEEYIRLLDRMCDGGWSNIDGSNAERLLSYARRLSTKGA
jgi:hypothetical protein